MIARSILVLLMAAPFVAADEPTVKTPQLTEIVLAGQVTKDDPLNPNFGVPSKLHAQRLEKGRAYAIEVTAPNAILFVADSTGNFLAQAQRRGNSARLRFTAPKDDVFLIHAGAYGALPVDYKLSIKPFVAPPVKLFPMPAPGRGKPSEIQGRLTNDDSPDQYREFPGKIHVVELQAGKSYVFDMTSKEFDSFLLLQDANAVLIAQDDDSGGNLNSRIRFQPPAAGRYRLVASTYNGNMGAFTLRVTEQ